MLRVMVCIAIGGFLVFSLYRYYLFYRDSASLKHKDGVNYRNPLFSPESPGALFNKAADFFGAGNIREAWACCLCGTIAAYTRYGEILFPPDATEYGCLSLVRSARREDAAGFERLVREWILLAYAGKDPPEGSFEKALGFGRALENSLTAEDPALAEASGA
jgi:hypothetical protein